MIYLDTHAAAGLYAGGAASLSLAAADQLRAAEDVRVSPMVRLELQYLYEIDRVNEPAATVMDALSATFGLLVCDAPFPAVLREAEHNDWTRDPFDRLIVAQAALNDAPLITKDRTLHAHYSGCLW